VIARLGLLLAPSKLFACAVCFGKNDNPGLVAGLTWGIAILVGATFLSVAWLAAAIIEAEKKKEAADALLIGASTSSAQASQ
jgi:hypothetical protein